MKVRGFTLIEVMVTLVILLFGLLGLAGLIVKGQRAAYEAYQRQQALTVANDIAERLRANQSPVSGTTLSGGAMQDNLWIAAQYAAGATVAIPLGDPTNPTKWNALMVAHSTPDCGTAVCTRAQLVEYDLGLWEGLLLGVTERRVSDDTRLGGIVNARGCIEGPMAAPSPPNTFRVSVAWQGDEETAEPTASACGAGLYFNKDGIASNRTRRLVSIDVTLVPPL